MTRRPVSIFTTVALIAVALLHSAPLRASEAKEVAPQLLGYYLKMQAALAADSAAGVAENAALIAKEAAAYAKYGSERSAYAALGAVAATVDGKDLATLREQFKSLSVAMDTVLRGAGASGTKGGWFLFHCPMAGGYWIQADVEVRNPYYGKAMLRCGDRVDGVKSRSLRTPAQPGGNHHG